MRKFLLLLCAMLLLPALAMAANQQLTVSSSASVGATSTKPYCNRLIVPYEALGNGSLSTRPMEPTDNYTVAIWARPFTSFSSTATVKEKGGPLLRFGKANDLDYYGTWNISLATGGKMTLRGSVEDANSAAMTGFCATDGTALPDITLNTWIYLAVVVDNTNLKATVYLNGENVHSANLTAPLYYSGADANFSAGGLGLSTLYVDEMQFFNVALTDDEIANAMIDASGMKNLQGHYTFDEVSGKVRFNNVNYASDVTAQAYYARTTGTTKISSGIGMIDATNTDYPYTATVSACNRVVEMPVSIDPEIQNGTLVAKVDGEVLSLPANIAAGTKVTLEATPAEGYQLVDYYAIAGGVRQLLEVPEYTISKTTVFSAAFTNQFYKLTVENPVNVPYTITLKGQEVTDLDNLVPGTVYKLALNVQDEAVLRNVQLNGKVLPAELDGSYLITIEDAATLLINAEMRQQYTVTYPTYEQGVIKVTNAAGEEVASGSTLLEGNVVTLKVIGNAGYAPSVLKVNGSAVPNNSPCTVNRDIEIEAEFVTGAESCIPTSEGSMTNTRTDNARGLSKAEITDGESKVEISATGAYANGAFGTANGRKLYDADAAIPTITTKPGATITITTTGAGEWMDTYVFFDQTINGLDTEDLVVSRGGGKQIYMADTYTFQIPTDTPTGMHRMRYINEWITKNDDGTPATPVNPCELASSAAGDGAVAFDVDILVLADVLEAERTITVATENEAYGSVAITNPVTEGNTVTTDAHYVTVTATPAEGYSFLNWTDGEGNQVSVSPEFEYDGEADINLVAHFGFNVDYTLTGNGSLSVNDAAGRQVVRNQVVAIGEQLTFKFTPAAAHVVSVFSVNGVDRVADIKDNEVVIEVTENLNVEVEFAEVVAHISWVVRGNGTVTAGYECNDDFDGTVDSINSGDAFDKALFDDNGGLTFFIYPGKADNGDYESIESATCQEDEKDAEDILEDVEAGNDAGPNEDGLTAEGAPVYYYTISERPSADVLYVFAFTNNGASSSIDDIFGDEEAGAPAEYYNVNGIRVNGDNLTPGIYVVKKGTKTAKVMVM